MSPRLPRLTSGELRKIIEVWGFSLVRQKGSHMQFKNNQGVRITIPEHGNKILHPKIIKTVLHDTGREVADLEK